MLLLSRSLVATLCTQREIDEKLKYFRLSIINDDMENSGSRKEGKNEAIFLITMLLIMYFLSYMPGGTREIGNELEMASISIEREKFFNPQLSAIFIIVTEKNKLRLKVKEFV